MHNKKCSNSDSLPIRTPLRGPSMITVILSLLVFVYCLQSGTRMIARGTISHTHILYIYAHMNVYLVDCVPGANNHLLRAHWAHSRKMVLLDFASAYMYARVHIPIRFFFCLFSLFTFLLDSYFPTSVQYQIHLDVLGLGLLILLPQHCKEHPNQQQQQQNANIHSSQSGIGSS